MILRIPFSKRLAVIGHRLFGGDFSQLVLPGICRDELADGGVAEIRADGGGTESKTTGDLMHVADLAGFDDQRRPEARADAGEMMVDGADREQSGDRYPLGGGGPVGEDQDVMIVLNGCFSFVTKCVETFLEPGSTFRSRPCHIENYGWKSLIIKMFDLLQAGVRTESRCRD